MHPGGAGPAGVDDRARSCSCLLGSKFGSWVMTRPALGLRRTPSRPTDEALQRGRRQGQRREDQGLGQRLRAAPVRCRPRRCDVTGGRAARQPRSEGGRAAGRRAPRQGPARRAEVVCSQTSPRRFRFDFHIVKATFFREDYDSGAGEVHGLRRRFRIRDRRSGRRLAAIGDRRSDSRSARTTRGRGRARPWRRGPGSATPTRRPSAAMPPLSTSTSVRRRASDVLQHRRLVPERLVDGLLDGLGGLRISSMPDGGADRERLRDQPVDLDPQLRVGADLPDRQAGQGRERAGRGVEDDLGPLRSASVVQGERAQAAVGEKPCQSGDLVGAGRAGLERAEPGVARARRS